jgi:sulfate adenylyltransferase
MDSYRVTPHGGELVNLIADQSRADEIKASLKELQTIVLNTRQLSDLELLMNGGFSPLRGFLTRSDYESVIDRMRLSDGTLWPIPVCLDVSGAEAARFKPGQTASLCDREGFMLAVIHIEDIWSVDKTRESEQVYGTHDIEHPGVDYLMNQTGSHYIGGRVEGIQFPLHYAYKRYRHTPEEIRAMYRKLGWRRIVGFQTRNPLHQAQFEMTLRAMADAKANLLLHPVMQRVKPGDIDTYTRIRCYEQTSRNYPPNMMMLSLVTLNMRMAGPREALWHAIIRKNYGCTHFIVGQDHAGPGLNKKGRPFYDPDAAKDLAGSFSDELGIVILPFDEMVYVVDENAYMPKGEMPQGAEVRRLTQDEFNLRLRTGKPVPDWFTFPEVIEELRQAHPPRHSQGFTIFLTGLSGAGKSTVAKVLYARFCEMGKRPVTLLDGDIVRLNLSSELGFSKEHRDINVRRIGFVASEITKNRGVAICAPIAPYTETRRQIRQLIETYGGFVEVYVDTPLSVCEQRDRKGLYAKARAGLIKGFTGVDDPYESPAYPEVRINTTDLTPDEAVQEVLLYLERVGYIR